MPDFVDPDLVHESKFSARIGHTVGRGEKDIHVGEFRLQYCEVVLAVGKISNAQRLQRNNGELVEIQEWLLDTDSLFGFQVELAKRSDQTTDIAIEGLIDNLRTIDFERYGARALCRMISNIGNRRGQ